MDRQTDIDREIDRQADKVIKSAHICDLGRKIVVSSGGNGNSWGGGRYGSIALLLYRLEQNINIKSLIKISK